MCKTWKIDDEKIYTRRKVLDIDRRLMISFSFTVKLVSEIMRASWGFPPKCILSM